MFTAHFFFPAQGIEAEFTKRSEVNWSGKPDPAQRGCAQKTKYQSKQHNKLAISN
jgi:hypothetical protein